MQLPDSSHRDEYRVRQRQLVTDLTKCHEELTNIRPLLEGLPSVCQLKHTFSFKDALAFDETLERMAEEPAVDALKKKIAVTVQVLAAKGKDICRAEPDLQAYNQRLEQQFHVMQKILIEQEQTRCGEKVGALCSGIEQIVAQLESFPNRPDRLPELLRSMALSLRKYAQSNLGHPAVLWCSAETADANMQETPRSLPLEVFFDQLDNLAVDTLTRVLGAGQNRAATN